MRCKCSHGAFSCICWLEQFKLLHGQYKLARKKYWFIRKEKHKHFRTRGDWNKWFVCGRFQPVQGLFVCAMCTMSYGIKVATAATIAAIAPTATAFTTDICCCCYFQKSVHMPWKPVYSCAHVRFRACIPMCSLLSLSLYYYYFMNLANECTFCYGKVGIALPTNGF